MVRNAHQTVYGGIPYHVFATQRPVGATFATLIGVLCLVRYRYRKNLLESRVLVVRRPNADGVTALSLVVKACDRLQVAVDIDSEESVVRKAFTIDESVGVSRGAVRVGGVEEPQHSSRRKILGHRGVREREFRGSLVGRRRHLRKAKDARGDDLGGDVYIRSIPLPQLAVFIITHSEKAAIRLEDQTVRPA